MCLRNKREHTGREQPSQVHFSCTLLCLQDSWGLPGQCDVCSCTVVRPLAVSNWPCTDHVFSGEFTRKKVTLLMSSLASYIVLSP
ncbi:hypothetical protein PoB_006612500 [Plakobranchus ocellatus]|uniref:Uncharacterized protein n=1 Tax=Plakobranchus ocellatus TaxID=259542 RepID=A0AAV4D6B2_9GAST|nr:hypothetical protein PoB_006612500 [Plakobranchus ocellatus]